MCETRNLTSDRQGHVAHPQGARRGCTEVPQKGRGAGPLYPRHAMLWSCPTLRPPRTVAAGLPCPWDFPDKNTGVGCHLLLQGPGSSRCRDQTHVSYVSCITRRDLYH